MECNPFLCNLIVTGSKALQNSSLRHFEKLLIAHSDLKQCISMGCAEVDKGLSSIRNDKFVVSQ